MSTGRFAPSPTGVLHLGNLRTAVLAWLFARSAGSSFLMRMEDLDTGRVRAGLAAQQLADLAAVGVDWDGPVVEQSSRHGLYEAALERLRRDKVELDRLMQDTIAGDPELQAKATCSRARPVPGRCSSPRSWPSCPNSAASTGARSRAWSAWPPSPGTAA